MPTGESKAMLGDRAFSMVESKLSNSLPEELHSMNNVDCFKHCLKTHLFKEAFCGI